MPLLLTQRCPAIRDSPTQVGSLTPKVYSRVGELFRDRYGAHAGWAHSLLFAAELPLFRPALSEEMLAEMATFRAAGKASRQQEKQDRAEAKAAGRPYKRPVAQEADDEPAPPAPAPLAGSTATATASATTAGGTKSKGNRSAAGTAASQGAENEEEASAVGATKVQRRRPKVVD